MAKSKQFEELMASSPGFRDTVEQVRKMTADAVITDILEQNHIGIFATIQAVREGCSATIKWKFNSTAGSPHGYKVTGLMREMTLFPSATYGMERRIYDGYGESGIALEFQEGRSYYFQFCFEQTHPAPIQGRELIFTDYGDIIPFQISIPLSDEKRALLEKVESLESNPAEKVRDQLQGFLDMQDTFDEMCNRAIERIKRKMLPPDEEEDQISRFREYANQMKERMKI